MRVDLSGLPAPPIAETWEERTARELLVTIAARMATMPDEEEARHCYRLARALAKEQAHPTPVPEVWVHPHSDEEELEP